MIYFKFTVSIFNLTNFACSKPTSWSLLFIGSHYQRRNIT